MTEQEAINGLKRLFGEYELDLPCTDSLEVLDMAIKALEKQILKNKQKKYVKHTFEFETEEDWKPMTTMCWVDCPFKFMIGLDKSCVCLDKRFKIKCPFISGLK